MKDENVKSSFAIHEVVVLSGFTKYMLDYLAREDIFRPSIGKAGTKGRRRCYSYEDVVLLRALHAVCVGKGKIRHLKDSLRALRKEFGPITPGQQVDNFLFVQGNELCLYTPQEGGRQLRSGQMTLSFVIDMRAVSNHIANAVKVDARSGVISLTRGNALKAEAERQRIWSPIKTRRSASTI